jgi:acetyltransferase
MKREIDLFFNAKVIALIGASEIKDKVGGILFDKIKKSKAKLIPINPKHEEIFGLKCYKSILEYDNQIDLAIIAIPALFVAQSLEECGKKGIKAVIIISAGFSEIGNINGEEKLISIANKYGISLLGPNCFGIVNPHKNLDTTFSMANVQKGKIAFISQSGALWSYISDFSKSKGLGFSGFVSLGNMAQLSFSDFLDYFSKDKKTKSIILYVEKLKEGKEFLKLATKIKKPIYAIKAGKSNMGSQATFSHTASLASDYEIYKGAFKQSGIILCDSIEEAFEKTAKKSLITKQISEIKIGRRIFIITNAGGAGALMSDYLSEKGFEIVEKPLDIIGTASGSDYFNNLEKIKNRVDFDSIIVILTAQNMTEIKKTADVIANFKNQTGRIIIPVFLGDKIMKSANRVFEENNIPYFNDFVNAKESLVF